MSHQVEEVATWERNAKVPMEMFPRRNFFFPKINTYEYIRVTSYNYRPHKCSRNPFPCEIELSSLNAQSESSAELVQKTAAAAAMKPKHSAHCVHVWTFDTGTFRIAKYFVDRMQNIVILTNSKLCNIAHEFQLGFTLICRHWNSYAWPQRWCVVCSTEICE